MKNLKKIVNGLMVLAVVGGSISISGIFLKAKTEKDYNKTINSGITINEGLNFNYRKKIADEMMKYGLLGILGSGFVGMSLCVYDALEEDRKLRRRRDEN